MKMTIKLQKTLEKNRATASISMNNNKLGKNQFQQKNVLVHTGIYQKKIFIFAFSKTD